MYFEASKLLILISICKSIRNSIIVMNLAENRAFSSKKETSRA